MAEDELERCESGLFAVRPRAVFDPIDTSGAYCNNCHIYLYQTAPNHRLNPHTGTTPSPLITK
jgi:hypothetical protein